MKALVATAGGTFEVDLETDEVAATDMELDTVDSPALNLPRLVAAAASGATVYAVVDTRPPLAVSHDAGSTWRASGHGLPAGRAIAVSDDNPDVALFAARNRLYLTSDGGRFWTASTVELPEIEAVELITAG